MPDVTPPSSPVAPKVDEDAEAMAELTVMLVEIGNEIAGEHGDDVADRLVSKLGGEEILRLYKHLKEMKARLRLEDYKTLHAAINSVFTQSLRGSEESTTTMLQRLSNSIQAYNWPKPKS